MQSVRWCERRVAGYVPEVQSKHVHSHAPAPAIFFPQEALGCIHGEPRGDNDVRAAAQQLQAALVADLLAAARDERVPEASLD